MIMDKKEYNNLLLKYYNENNANIEKWIFLGSTGALSILVSFSNKINTDSFLFFIISIFCFLITITMQLISAYISKMGCDLGLDKDGNFNEKSCRYFDISENLNKGFMITFIIALFMTSIAIIYNDYIELKKYNNSKDNLVIEQQIKVKEFEYYRNQGVKNE